MVHSTAVGEVVQFNLGYLGESEIARGNDELGGCAYMQVLLEDVRGFI